FYCPAPQTSDDPPISQGLTFETAESYSEYINYFGFKGASFSGGEPLLSADKVVKYLKQLRKNSDPKLYIWMYTNGILANENTFKELAEHGLNEIRFDLGATGYKLEGLKKAIGIIPNVTVEIPAVPEELKKLKSLLHTLDNLCVKYLNLHQLRLTQHNAPKLTKHPYTFIHAEQPIVLESELTALELLSYAAKENLNIGINYCSFFFKNRYQRAGYQSIINNKLKNPYEPITDKGFIRIRNGSELRYETYKLWDQSTQNKNAQTLKLSHKTYQIRRIEAEKFKLYDDMQILFTELIEAKDKKIPNNEFLFRIWQHEQIENGLRDLF
ncbi:MAG: hypothetical protein C0599_11340, partial [Salinivirgaceae bacterium]